MAKKRGNIVLITLAIVGVLAASVGGYFWWSAYVKTSADKQIFGPNYTKNSSLPKEKEELETGANTWKEYVFSSSISVRLPQNVDAPKFVNTGRYAVETTLPNGSRLQMYGADGPSPNGDGNFRMSVGELADPDRGFLIDQQKVSSFSAAVFSAKKIGSDMVNGGEVYKEIYGLVVLTLKGQFVIELYLPQNSDGDFEKDKKLFDQILSTFKFIYQPLQKTGYVCPPQEWVNCMPGQGLDATVCSQDYLTWAKANCSNFKGAAY